MWKVRKADTGKVYAAGDLRTLQGWCRDGRVVEADLVCSDQDPNWRAAGSLFDLSAHFQSLHTRAATTTVVAGGAGAGPSAGRDSRRRERPGRRRSGGDSDADSIDPDLTSMMDMAFILVILLMVISTPAFQHGLPVNLPEAGGADSPKTEVVVAISKDGAVAVGDKKLNSADELVSALEDQKTKFKSGQASLILRADKDARHGDVVHVMDILRRKCRITNISMATKPLSGS